MASKKELEERIAVLEAEVALLRSRPSQPVVLPAPSYPYWPHDYYPYGWPKVWCATTANTLTYTPEAAAAV